jgi:hypothetical protein
VIDELKKLRRKGDIFAFIPSRAAREVVTVLACAGLGTLTAILSDTGEPTPVAGPVSDLSVERSNGVSPETAGALVGGSCWAGSHLN